MFKVAVLITSFLMIVTFNVNAEEGYVTEVNGSKVLNLSKINQDQKVSTGNSLNMREYTPSDLGASANAIDVVHKMTSHMVQKALQKNDVTRKVASTQKVATKTANTSINFEMKAIETKASMEIGEENKTKIDVNLIKQRIGLEFIKRLSKDSQFFISSQQEGTNSSDRMGVRWSW